jgi:hypothetical protein
MKEIALSNRGVCLVDDGDYDWISQWSWGSIFNEGIWYACGVINKRRTLMHRLITDAPNGILVDHKDRNGLNNQRENLRLCTNTQNQWNSKTPITNTSGYKGVCWHSDTKKYMASISINGKRIYLGYYDNPIDAAKAYDKAAILYRGEYARTNF